MPRVGSGAGTIPPGHTTPIPPEPPLRPRARPMMVRDASGRRVVQEHMGCSHCGATAAVSDMHDSCGRCPSCCHCQVCRVCHRTVMSVCRRCAVCDACCHCAQCPRCGNRCDAAALCASCRRCSGCCVRTPNNAAHYINPEELTFWTHKGHAPNKILVSRRYVAAEIEVSSAAYSVSHEDATTPLDHAVERWHASVVHDSSMGDQGFEINTSPASGDSFVEQVHALCTALQMQHAVADNRCGCHIHVDARDYSYFELKKLLLLYAALEPAIFGISPPHRRSSHYCTPCAKGYFEYVGDIKMNGSTVSPHGRRAKPGHLWREHLVERQLDVGGQDMPVSWRVMREDNYTKHLKDAILSACYGHSDAMKVRRHRQSKGQGQHFRYRNLNLHSWFYRHTLEWRIPEGSIGPRNITMWAALFSCIMDTASSWSERQIVDLIKCTAPPTPDALKALADGVVLLKLIVKGEGLDDWINYRLRTYATVGPHAVTTEWMVFK